MVAGSVLQELCTALLLHVPRGCGSASLGFSRGNEWGQKPAPTRIFTRQVRPHDAVETAVETFHDVALRVVGRSCCLLNLQPVTYLMPDGVLEFLPMITVDPHRAS